MKNDPFGNLNDWGTVLELVEELAGNDQLENCQAGLIRILRHKGNWQLREEVLKRVGDIQTPSSELVFQILATLSDDNIYYDARILAGNALIQLLKSIQDGFGVEINKEIRKVVEKLRRTPQPFFLDEALKRLHIEVDPHQPETVGDFSV
jgi:hypothetical protein